MDDRYHAYFVRSYDVHHAVITSDHVPDVVSLKFWDDTS